VNEDTTATAATAADGSTCPAAADN